MAKPQSIKEILDKSNFVERVVEGNSRITEEFQDFGYRLALKLDDLDHKALYMKFAKVLPRGILEEVMEFTLDYPLKTGKRARVFMWKLGEVCKQKGYRIPAGRMAKPVKVKKKKPQLDLI